MNDTTKIILYAFGIYVTFVCSGLYLAHGEEAPQGLPADKPLQSNGSGGFPQHYTVPRISRTDPLMRKRDSKTCHEYLAICERSCRERGSLFKFQCIGKDFQPFQEHFRCICADDLLVQRATLQKANSIQVKVAQSE